MNRLALCFIIFHLNILAYCQISGWQNGELVEINHDLTIENGEAVLTVPIQVLKGINGLQPEIKLQYRSSNPMNREIGIGWLLMGVSEVYRCQKNFAFDNFYDTVNYNYSDVFCLEGQRLVLAKGTYGYEDSEYRTEIDRYRKIVASNEQHGNGPKYFKVYTKENIIYTYGDTISSSIGPISPTNNLEIGTPGRWLLSKIEDYNGNLIKFNYLKEPHYAYLANITYSNRIIRFNYDKRNDIQTRYVNKLLELNMEKILRSISLIVNDKELKRYELEYNQYGASKSNQLKSIKLCTNEINGDSSLCSKPLEFDYEAFITNTTFDETQTAIFSICGDSSLCELKQVADMNGDGLQDIVAFGGDGIYVSLNKGGKIFEKAAKWSIDFTKLTGWNSTRHLRFIADINNDQLPDIIGFGDSGIYVSLNANGYFKAIEKWLDGWSVDQGYKIDTNSRWLSDANNDGFLDFIVIASNGTYIGFNKDGIAFKEPIYTVPCAIDGWGTKYHTLPVDIDGDGLKEKFGFGLSTIVAYPLYSTVNIVRSDLITNLFTTGWSFQNTRLVVDVNNDNLADLVGFAANSSGYVYLSTVDSSLNISYKYFNTTGRFGDNTVNRPQYAVDLNNDGLVDLISFDCTGIFVSINCMTHFETPTKWSSNILTCDSEPRFVTDMNGDLIPDFVGFYGQFASIGYNSNKKPKLINVTDSLGNVKTITYSTLAIESNKMKDSKFTANISESKNENYTSFGNNVDIVTMLVTSDGSGGQNILKYSYGPYRCSKIQGKSECTFIWILTEDVESEMVFIDEYYQENPLAGIVRNKKGYYKDNLIYEKRFKYMVRSRDGQVNRDIVLVGKSNEVHDLDGTYIKSEITEYTYDDYGNTVVTIENVTDNKNLNVSRITLFKYRNNETTWFIGEILSKSIVNLQQTNTTYIKSIVRDEYYEYHETNRVLYKRTTHPDDPDIGLEETFEYDKYGNAIVNIQKALTKSPNKVSNTRTRHMYYDSNGLNTINLDNALLQRQSYRYDSADNVVRYTDMNGVITSYKYDNFGRKLSEKDSQGRTTLWLYEWDWPQSLPNSVYKITSVIDDTIRETKYYDSLNREIRKLTLGYNGEEICEDSIYNTLGSIVKRSKPYKLNREVPKYLTFEYDGLLREIKRIEGFERDNTIQTQYVGLKVIKSDKSGRFTINTKNIIDQVIKVEDSMGSIAQYEYDVLGNLAKFIDPQGSVMTLTYNLNGQKLTKNDPAMGLTTYKYNAFNELIYSRNAKGDEIILETDVLGRTVKRIEKEGVTTWTFDTESKGIGKLGKISGPNNYTVEYKYDDYSRVTEQSLKYDKDSQYLVKTTYDKLNRIISQTYPSSTVVYNCYNKYGYLSAVSMNDSTCESGILWKSNGYDAIGNIESETYGNSITNEYTYTEGSQVSKIISTKEFSPSNYLRRLEYEYDSRQNLVKRSDFDQTKRRLYQQKYSYDILNRLTFAANYESTDLTSNSLKLAESFAWMYDPMGNLLSYHDKNEYLYEYDPLKFQQATKIGNDSVEYDELGNVIRTGSYDIDWYTFSKAKTIITKKKFNSTRIQFAYGPDRDMITKTVSTVNSSNDLMTITHYIGDTYERLIKKNATYIQIIDKYHIKVYGKIVATHMKVQLNRQPSDSVTLYYHNDAFGSLDSISDSSGSIVLRYIYSAYGQVKVINSNLSADLSQFIDTDYVGHSHLEGTRLIYMNGRIFDSVFARFLSPDPYIQDLYNIQNLNRYSYALNNPFKYKDPNGHFWGSIKRFFTNPKVILATVVAVATAGIASAILAPALLATMGVASTSLAGAVISGAVVGASSGFAGTLVATGGDVNTALKGALVGGITGGLSGGINLISNDIARFAANKVVDGISNRIQKRDFFEGFEVSALSFIAAQYYKSAVGYEVTAESGGDAMQKDFHTPPIKGANNIGFQGYKIDPNSLLNEGGIVSRALNKVGGINAVAGMHDSWQVKLPELPRNILNVPLMPIAGAVTYLALYNDIKCPYC